MPESTHRGGSASSAVGTVAFAQASSVPLIGANALRNGLSVFNGAPSGGPPVFLGYGATAVASQSMPLLPQSYLYEPDFTGTVAMIVPVGTAPVFVLEVG